MTNWYVLFVRGSYEQKVCDYFNKQDGLSAFLPKKEVIHKKEGKLVKLTKQLFPGYVFIETEMNHIEFHQMIYELRNRVDGIVRNLEHDLEGTPALYDSERELIERLVNKDRVVEHSVGVIEGDKIIVTEGPLMGFESYITHIDRHKRICTLEIDMMGSKRDMKVSLEIVSKI